MMQEVASVVRELEPEDVHLLSGVEHGMRFSEWVNRETLPEFSRLGPEEVNYRLERALRRDLIERRTIQYEGFTLTSAGYDALALHAFAEADVLDGVGAPLGVGKESDVYEVQSYRPMALKFHREGYTNFREVHRGRDYTADREHTSWLYTARVAAEREFDALETLYPGVSVPQPVEQNRHAIVMERVDGVELSRAELRDEQVVGVVDLVLDEIAAAYDAGLVHADASEYNVFVDADGVTLFDWPQAVPVDHENADEFLERDVENVLAYFRRKYPGQTPDVDAATVTERVAADAFDGVRALP
ncbi:MAG: serine/threonine-protein kinase RIO2 [Halobacteriaceae archaeon]